MKLFNRKKNNNENANKQHLGYPIRLNRKDGSFFELLPYLDENNNSIVENFPNAVYRQNIPKFEYRIYFGENNDQFAGYTFLADIDIHQVLKSPAYANYIANNFFSADRVSKIQNEYGDYAGGIRYNHNTNSFEKYKDMPIVRTCVARKEAIKAQRKAEQAKSESDFRESLIAQAKAQGVHIKTSHAEDLSKYTYRQNMAHDDEGR